MEIISGLMDEKLFLIRAKRFMSAFSMGDLWNKAEMGEDYE